MLKRNSRRIKIIIFFSVVIVFGGLTMAFSQTSFFEKSLHIEASGMKHAYERGDGLMKLTEAPYEKLDCKNCHVKTCDACHATMKGDNMAYSLEKAKNPETCMKACHGKEGLTFMLGEQQGNLDVHVANGMGCMDCHTGEDVHGDGNVYMSMREPGAVKASCTNCHEADTSIRSHSIHGEKLDCSACHVSSSVSCMNCHFDTFEKTGKRDGIFFLMNTYLLLMNRDKDGKVTCGTAMSFVTKNKKFVVYAPQFTHSIQAKGKDCEECHANEAMKLIQQGKSVPMMTYKDGKMDSWKGVVPALHEKLEWQYFNKKGDQWIPLSGVAAEAKQSTQWWYAKPLTKEQVEKLSLSVK